MGKMYQVPLYNQIIRPPLRLFFRGLLSLLSPITVTGVENVPKAGAYIIAMNHVSTYEAPFILAYWPTLPESMGAIDIWQKPGQNVLVRLYGAIPVHRGEFDRQTLERAIGALASGRPLLIAPEGGRTHKPGMRQAQPGVAYLADKTNLPIIPVGIIGTTEDYAARAFQFKRPPLAMHIGKPIHFPPVRERGEERRRIYQQNTDLVMAQIAALLPPEYQGVYAPKTDL